MPRLFAGKPRFRRERMTRTLGRRASSRSDPSRLALLSTTSRTRGAGTDLSWPTAQGPCDTVRRGWWRYARRLAMIGGTGGPSVQSPHGSTRPRGAPAPHGAPLEPDIARAAQQVQALGPRMAVVGDQPLGEHRDLLGRVRRVLRGRPAGW